MSVQTVAPLRQVRAVFDAQTVRVYQAYSREIGLPAVRAQTFVPPFKMERMTWIKPSFTWMMYRSGWGTKSGQEVVLGIDVTREGFEQALANAAVSHFDPTLHASEAAWRATVDASPVRIQWDPERTLALAPLAWRAIQIGLGGETVEAYVRRWIVRIEDVTPLATEIAARIADGDNAGAAALRPVERPYPLSREIAVRIGASAR